MRSLFTLAALVLLAAHARPADPPLGKTIEIETQLGGPKLEIGLRGSHVFNMAVEQGDKLKFEVSPVGGADMKVHVFVMSANGQKLSSSGTGSKVDWEMPKGAPGKSIRVAVMTNAEGKLNMRVSKVGDPMGGGAAVGDASDEVKKLRAENAELRKQLADQKKQLDEIIELLKKKK